LHQLLADSSANISAGDENDRTPLHYAAIYGNIGAIQALFAAGADLEPRDAPGGTPLHLASEEGQVAAVSYLLDLGSPIETTDNSGCRAIHRAVHERHDSVVELLLQRGASVLGRGEATRRSGSPPTEALFRVASFSWTLVLLLTTIRYPL
jgi:ankyrin